MNDQLMQQLQEIYKQREAIDAQLKSVRKEAIQVIQQLIDAFGLKASCFRFQKNTGVASRSPVKQKYRDPETEKTWSGRGRCPYWMREALDSGKRKEDFLICD